jgi:tryptophan synthase alpha chain
VELGIPFSDPLADGTTIQKASFHALQNGVTPKVCLEMAKELSQKVEAPLVFMTYFNLIFSYGLEEFCDACAKSGIDGLIIPDMPPEEGLEMEAATQRHGLDLIYLLAPTSTEERIRLVAERSRDFIYLVSVTGVTGARDKMPSELGAFVARVRSVASQPLCVGFGISTPRQAEQVARIADGVIVGSRIIQLMESEEEPLSLVRDFAGELRIALDKPEKDHDPSND